MKFFPLNRDAAVPLYVQLADIIKNNINQGCLAPGAPIPSEAKLMKSYDVSRITVRNALLRLEYSGEIFKVHGRGSFVSDRKLVDIPTPSHSWQRVMEDQGYYISYELVEFCDVWPSQGVQHELGLKEGELVTKYKRLKKMDDQVIGMDVLFMPAKIGHTIGDPDHTSFSMTEFLNSTPEKKIHRIEAQIRAAPIESGDAEVMKVDPSNTVLIRGYVAFNRAGSPVMSGKIIYLSQYAVVKVTVDAKSATQGNSLIEVPADEFKRQGSL